MTKTRAPRPGFVLDVPYADLVNDTETICRRVLAFCGLPFEAAKPRRRAKRRFGLRRGLAVRVASETSFTELVSRKSVPHKNTNAPKTQKFREPPIC